MIREVHKGDYLNLTALAIQVWLHTYATDGIRDEIAQFVLSEFNPESFRRIHKSKNQKILVKIHENHLVGFITVDLDSRCGLKDFNGYEVKTLYIQEFFQNRGIGAKLLDRVRKDYGTELWLTTWIHNRSAIKFYENYGFIKTGTAYFDLMGEKHENHVLAIWE